MTDQLPDKEGRNQEPRRTAASEKSIQAVRQFLGDRLDEWIGNEAGIYEGIGGLLQKPYPLNSLLKVFHVYIVWLKESDLGGLE